MSPYAADNKCFVCAHRVCSCLAMPDLSLPSTTSHPPQDWFSSYLWDTAPLAPTHGPLTSRLRNVYLQSPVCPTDAINTNSTYGDGSQLHNLSLSMPNVNNNVQTFSLYSGTAVSGPEHLYVPSYSSVAQWPLTQNSFSNPVHLLDSSYRNFHAGSACGDNNIMLTLHSAGSDSVDQPVDANQTPRRPEPRCWEHGCNGRLFCSHSNLFRHQRERSSRAPKSICPSCGKSFTRQDARDKHLFGNKCKRTKQQMPK